MKKSKMMSAILAVMFIMMLAFGCVTSPNVPDKPDVPDITDPVYSIMYHYEDGKTENKVVKIKQGSVVSLPADPTCEGLGFKGWFSKPNGEGERITVDTIPKGNIAVYAYWTEHVDMTNRNIIDIGGFNGITEYVDIPKRDKITNDRLKDENGNGLFYPTKYASEVDFSLLQELGVNTIYMTFDHWDLYPNNAHMQSQKQYIEYLNKYNLKCWFNDWELNDRLKVIADGLNFSDVAAVADAVKEVKKYTAIYEKESCFKGNYLCDEPDEHKLSQYLNAVKLYQIAMPKCQMYTNLFPNYAFQYHQDVKDVLYPAYMKYFTDHFKFDYLSIDNYGIQATKSDATGRVTRSVRTDYYWKCFRDAATAARNDNRNFENHIWATKDLYNKDEKRNYSPTMQDLRFETFNSMAFGASRINLYCASTPPSVQKSNPDFFITNKVQIGGWGCINNGEKTPELFDNVQTLVKEIKALKDVFPRFVWQEAVGFDAGKAGEENYGKSIMRALKGSYSGRLNNFVSTKDLVIGMFDEANHDGEAFMFVNNCDISKNENADISFSLVGARKVVAYIGMEVRELPKNADGKYALQLSGGQGAFVTVER